MKEVNNSPVTILAIDDEPAALERIAGVLENAGYRCCCAADAEAARDAAQRATPDLIISDVNLAGHSGLTVCEQLKQQIGISDAPVMYVSSTQVPDIIRRSHAAGGSYYLRKPFHASVLVQLVEKARLRAPARPKAAAIVPLRPAGAGDQPKPTALRAVMDRASALAAK